jgi:prepilin-type processing-associated H-X9-DG protein
MPEPDETLDAPVYQPPEPRRSRLVIASLVLSAVGGAAIGGSFLEQAHWQKALEVSSVPRGCGWHREFFGLGLAAGIAGAAAAVTARARLWKAEGNRAETLKVLSHVGMLAGATVIITAGALLLDSVQRWEHPLGYNCKSNLRQIGMACQIYADDNDGAYPPDPVLLYPEYLDRAKIFSCPSNPSKWWKLVPAGRWSRESTSYVYVSGLRSTDSGDCVLAFDRIENHQGLGGNVLFIDGHAEWVNAPAPAWDGAVRKLLDQTRAAVKRRGGEIRLVGE